MNDAEKTQSLKLYDKQELSEELLEQEVVAELNDQQLESIQGGALPIDVDTGHAVIPIITYIATGHTEVRPLTHMAMPIDIDTGQHVQPTFIHPDAQSRTNSPVRRNDHVLEQPHPGNPTRTRRG